MEADKKFRDELIKSDNLQSIPRIISMITKLKTPIYYTPTDKVIKTCSDPEIPRPVFMSSENLKIIGFKEGDNPSDSSEFTEVKPEFILDDGDRMVYLGNKQYVLPIYSNTFKNEDDICELCGQDIW